MRKIHTNIVVEDVYEKNKDKWSKGIKWNN